MKRTEFSFSNSESTPRAVALGFFDGIHLGHRAVLQRALDEASAGYTPAVFTFDTLPKVEAVGRLSDDAETASVLERMGFAEWIVAPFDALRDLSPEAFVRDVLCGALGAKAVVCGSNYHFGKGGAGDAAMLTALGEQYGLTVAVLPPVLADGEPVSSTRIRAAVGAGDLLTANRLLGRAFTIHAPVIDGQHLGRTLGTPTINQALSTERVLPRFGVYASAVIVDGRVTYGVTNIGIKPTVGGTEPLAETWIPEFEGDLYGQEVPVMPICFLRAEQTFSSLDELREQIRADGDAVRRLFSGEGNTPARAVLFDFDDTLQDRPVAFLAFSRYFVKRHFPDLPPAEQEARAVAMARLNGDGYVRYPDYVEEVKALFSWENAPENETILWEIQRDFPLFTSLLPGVAEGLCTLREKGWRLGVITNGYSRMQNKKLDVCGLRPLLDAVVVSGDEGVHKPDPELFRRAAMRLGVACKHCVFVGDHPVNDIAGAVAAGMRPVFIQASGKFPPPADVPLVHSMTELLEYLEI